MTNGARSVEKWKKKNALQRSCSTRAAAMFFFSFHLEHFAYVLFAVAVLRFSNKTHKARE